MKTLRKKVSCQTLVGMGFHIGCHRREWLPDSETYLVGYRHGVSIFDLAQTSFHLRRALKFVETVIARYGHGFFYGFTGQADRVRAEGLAALGQIVSTERWSGGFVTNTRQFHNCVFNTRKFPHFVVCFRFEIRNYSVLREKTRLKLPLVCPIDSNSDPSYAEYPIPAGASNRANVGYLGGLFSRAAFRGFGKRLRRLVSLAKVFRREKRLAKKKLKRSRRPKRPVWRFVPKWLRNYRRSYKRPRRKLRGRGRPRPRRLWRRRRAF